MRQHLQQTVEKHGFETRMTYPCGLCGDATDLPAMIVHKSDIETHEDFGRFRAFRQLEKDGDTEVIPFL